jgi:hypothetical protein
MDDVLLPPSFFFGTVQQAGRTVLIDDVLQYHSCLQIKQNTENT